MPGSSMRHESSFLKIVHAYFEPNWQILWGAAIGDIPVLRAQILEILKEGVFGIRSRQRRPLNPSR